MIYKKCYLSVFVILVLAIQATAQHTMAGKIEYVRKINVHAQMKDNDDDNSWYERMKSQTPQFNYSYFDLTFDTGRSIYKPGKEVEATTKGYTGIGPAADNIVFSDFASQKVIAIKNVFEQKFLVQDSMRKIEWKAKDEIRIIADYKCRKAVGIICDSVYVVAFYAEDIPLSGGPEMFGGLPGMILELAIPRLHTTWVADKIELTIPKDSEFSISLKKGKSVTQKTMNETIQSSLKDWGNWGTKYMWWTAL